MGNRKSIGKKLRFEVFKRDNFKCQYCGKVSPNVILEVDHISPVSKGGSNDLLNLITSCFDCNRGKTNLELDDDSVVAKQRKQLEKLQERREQIELMFRWRSELDNLSDDTAIMVRNYIESKIEGLVLNEYGIKKIDGLTKKFELSDILESIDISAEKYLNFGKDGLLIKETVEEFINKIGGILVNKNRPVIEQKKSYIKGICRNRFGYWDPKKGSIILNQYVDALRTYGWTEEKVLQDLEDEVIPKTKEAKNWSEWKDLLEKWTNDVNNWEKHDEDHEVESISNDELENLSELLFNDRINILPALEYIGSVFKDFDNDKLLPMIDATVIDYLGRLEDYYKLEKEKRQGSVSYHKSMYSVGLNKLFKPIENMLTFHLDNSVSSIFEDYFGLLEDVIEDNAKPEHFNLLLNFFTQKVKSEG